MPNEYYNLKDSLESKESRGEHKTGKGSLLVTAFRPVGLPLLLSLSTLTYVCLLNHCLYISILYACTFLTFMTFCNLVLPFLV